MASMGPRLLSRGENLGNPENPALVPASMGPRLLSRGEYQRSLVTLEFTTGFNGAAASQPRRVDGRTLRRYRFRKLQWGRGFSAAERKGAGVKMICCIELQWGRGFSAAER